MNEWWGCGGASRCVRGGGDDVVVVVEGCFSSVMMIGWLLNQINLNNGV